MANGIEEYSMDRNKAKYDAGWKGCQTWMGFNPLPKLNMIDPYPAETSELMESQIATGTINDPWVYRYPTKKL